MIRRFVIFGASGDLTSRYLLPALVEFRAAGSLPAENAMGFHGPQELARILAESINFSRQGQAALPGSVG
jgi:glucose-6-phosphate 1-dehydrogenase